MMRRVAKELVGMARELAGAVRQVRWKDLASAMLGLRKVVDLANRDAERHWRVISSVATDYSRVRKDKNEYVERELNRMSEISGEADIDRWITVSISVMMSGGTRNMLTIGKQRPRNGTPNWLARPTYFSNSSMWISER